MTTTYLLTNRPSLQALTRKVGGWIRRYLPADLAGTAAALIGITMAGHFDPGVVTIALVGVWSEFIGFYVAIGVQEWLAYRRRQSLLATAPANVSGLFGAVRQTTAFLSYLSRNLLLEFGAAELLDPFILRPALLTLALHLIPDLPLALMAGKLSADLIFYTVTIGSFELRKKILTP